MCPFDLSALNLIDSHAHLDMEQFDTDRKEVIKRASEAGVTRIVNVGIDLASSRKAAQLSHRHPIIMAAAGIHPQESANITEKDIKELSRVAEDPHVVAIGEVGLDFYHDNAPHEQQIRVLKWQLALADELRLPVIIHSRQSEKEMLGVLNWWRMGRAPSESPAGVIHCFNGSLETAQMYINLGFFISLGAYIGYPSSKDLREAIKALPLDKLIIETDCPFLPPQGRRGQRNEPAFVLETAKAIAEIRGLGFENIAQTTTANASRLFRLD